MTKILKMNMKRTSICTGVIGGIAVAGSAMAGMNGLSYDIVGEGLIADTYTVRVYAELDAGNRLDAVYGNGEFNMSIDYLGGASAYQDALGGATSQSINSAFFPLAPDLEWDSYMTIGALYSDGTPFGNNALQDIGIDWSTWDPAGGNLSANNGTLFVTPADPQGEAIGGRVLVAQLTTFSGDGPGVYDIHFNAGFQGKDEAGVTWQSGHEIFIGGVPAPGAVALLGLAGLAARRRRHA
jgi:MYXO-CTERM domain-containing protein